MASSGTGVFQDIPSKAGDAAEAAANEFSETWRSFRGSRVTLVVALLLIATYAAELTVVLWRPALYKEWFVLQVGRPFSFPAVLLSPFGARFEAPVSHFLVNLLGLIWFGPRIEEKIGGMPYLGAVLTLGILLGPVKVIYQGVGSIGASRYVLAFFIVGFYTYTERYFAWLLGEDWPWFRRLAPWVWPAIFIFGGAQSYAAGGGNLAHLLSSAASVPLILLIHRQRKLEEVDSSGSRRVPTEA